MELEAKELLQRLVRIDNANPPGQEAKAARILERFLARPGIETQILELAPGRASVYARVRGTEAESKPIVLSSHLDTLGADPGAWLTDRGPLSGALHDDAIFGRGTLSGKGAAVVHATVLVLLAGANERPTRDVILIASADGTRLAGGIDQLLISRPELLSAEMFLGLGGMSIRDLFGDGRLVHAVGTSEKGFVDLVLTAREDPPGQGPVSATERLNRALLHIREREARARLTAPVEETLRALADSTPFPRDLTLRSKLLAQIFELDALKAGAFTRAMVTDGVRVTDFVAEGPAGVAPPRATARLRAELLSDSDPGRIKQELRLAVDDERVHFNIIRGEVATSSPIDRELLDIIERHVSSGDHRLEVVVPVQTPWATDLRVVRRHGIPAYGFVPFELSIDDYEAQRGRGEHLSLQNLSRGIRRMFGIVTELSLAPPKDRG